MGATENLCQTLAQYGLEKPFFNLKIFGQNFTGSAGGISKDAKGNKSDKFEVLVPKYKITKAFQPKLFKQSEGKDFFIFMVA